MWGMYKKESLFLENGWDCVPKLDTFSNKALKFYEISKK